MRLLLRLLKDTFASWSAHNAQKMGAALAYYMVFSLAPMVMVLVGVTGLVVGHDREDSVRAEIIAKVSALMGDAGAATIDSILASPAPQAAGLWATLAGFVIVLVGASGVFSELQDSLNAIWEVPLGKRRWRLLIRKRLLSFGMVFALGLLVLMSLLFSAVIAALRSYMEGWAPGWDAAWEYSNTLVLLVLGTLLFAAIFRCLPDVKIAWRDVWTGAALTAVLFILGKFLLGLYIGHSTFASAYGAAGSLLVVLVWVFYSAQIFFFGAEFTRSVARLHGRDTGGPAKPAPADQKAIGRKRDVGT